MYKCFGLILLGVILTTKAWAVQWTDENCTNRGGSVVTAVNGDTYCASPYGLNFWSAVVWCQKHGGKLSTIKKLCLFDSPFQNADCPNMYYAGWQDNYWTSERGINEGETWTVYFSRSSTPARVVSEKNTYRNKGRALCE